MSIKLPAYDLDALLGLSDTKREGVSATNVVSTTEAISSTKISNTKVSSTKSVSDTKISATNGQKMNRWKRANRDTLRLDLPKGEKERLKAEAARRGMSLTAMVKAALGEYLERRPAE